MAWIVVDLDGTLLSHPMEQGSPSTAVEGAVEAMNYLQSEGHRLTVFTSRFAPMPASEKERARKEIEQDLAELGFPPLEIWTGTTKPAADIFLGDNFITFDQDWALAMAQMQTMLEERGLAAPPMPDDGSLEGLDDTTGAEGFEPPAEE